MVDSVKNISPQQNNLERQEWIVNSYTEFMPLQEVIVGTVRGACLSKFDRINRKTVPHGEYDRIIEDTYQGTGRYPAELIQAAEAQLNRLVAILEGEGIIVRRPDAWDFYHPYSTPLWQIEDCGFSAANPRDPFLVIGNNIIEAPMADRGRYFETLPYKSLMDKYADKGAVWVSAPKPALADSLYSDSKDKFAIDNSEICFDAADFVRCGTVIIGQLSNVTNQRGIDWLQRYLGDIYQVIAIENTDLQAIHIDTTLIPLAPGKLLVNPEYVNIDKLPKLLKKWDILTCPKPNKTDPKLRGMVSDWIGMNVFSIDERRVIVEANQTNLISALKDWGFEPIVLEFSNYYPFLGGLHCSTLDIRRDEKLENYF
jgi:glycine amidinotransferase